ncbi:MAG: sodium:solute symporter family protein [Alphaproteobacteria bacterium]|nr:sodium:solute symporter family protein [Alphaproteobacteria bacterium]
MLLAFVGMYLLVTIAIGLFAAKKVHSSADYVVAGRSLPIYVTIATVFATWFGSETVLGTSSTFLDEGIGGIITDPFGASLCLILVGVLFAGPLYRMKLLTIGDFYRRKYGRTVEVFVALAIMVSYLGWVSAQISALGLVFSVLTNGEISPETGMIVGGGIVLIYTLFGGMWSVALTDFMQMIMIVIGLIIIGFYVGGEAGGAGVVLNHAIDEGKFNNFFPEMNFAAVLAYIAAWVTMGFGSIPQQDVFQRVMSAKDEKTAVRGTVTGGALYFVFAFIPIFLAYSAVVIDPELVSKWQAEDSQMILPYLILEHTPLIVQVMFFGALLSAIMSTASGTLLAPSAMFSENIMRGALPHLSDKQFLLMLRGTVVVFAGFVLFYAMNTELSIFAMVENAYKVTLAGAFVPLFAGVYWKRANTSGATLSIVFGVMTWLFLEFSAPEGTVPPQLAGLAMAIVGMVIGGIFGKQHPEHA